MLELWNEPAFQNWRHTAEVVEKRLVYICVIWILRNCNREFLRHWWKQEVTSKILNLCNFLGECVHTFEYKSTEDFKEIGEMVLFSEISADWI